MKIDITNSPYYPEYKTGYVIHHKNELRNYIVLVRNDQSKSCTSYARYLMSVKLGRRLSADEEVDHIDENKLNDSVDNLQILTKCANIRKNKRLHKVIEHGKSAMYRSGCRCDLCVQYAKDMRNRWYRKNKKEFNRKRREKRKIRE